MRIAGDSRLESLQESNNLSSCQNRKRKNFTGTSGRASASQQQQLELSSRRDGEFPIIQWAIMNLSNYDFRSGLKSSILPPGRYCLRLEPDLIVSNGCVYRINRLPISHPPVWQRHLARAVNVAVAHRRATRMVLVWVARIVVLSRLESIMSQCSNSIDWLIEFFPCLVFLSILLNEFRIGHGTIVLSLHRPMFKMHEHTNCKIQISLFHRSHLIMR